MNVYRLIYEVRTREGLTQLQLAHVLNLTRSSVANMEGYRQSPGVFDIETLAKEFGLRITCTAQGWEFE